MRSIDDDDPLVSTASDDQVELKVDARVTPAGVLEVLSHEEVNQLLDTGSGGIHETFRRCCLAVLNCGIETDDARETFERYADFDVNLLLRDRGIKIELTNAPGRAFVDREMLQGIKEHLFAVLRDIVYAHNEIHLSGQFDLNASHGITDAVFHILRNAGILRPQVEPNLVVCWGGHSISRTEYDYAKIVGYELGLRGLNVCTGCGPGAMKGPMKGAALAHAKQRIRDGRYIGMTEPGIIAAESPNPIVNDLVIMPDIEKRLEAFVRVGHGVVVFPGGVGTAEEVLYLLGILLNPANADLPFPLVFAGARESEAYFRQIDTFIASALGPEARSLYTIVIDDPTQTARIMRDGMRAVRDYRIEREDAFYFNWLLKIERDFQTPFDPTHEAMASLQLNRDQPRHELAANLRRAFSGIVTGNVKDSGIRAIEAHGPFEITGDKALMRSLDKLLHAFARQSRMKLPGRHYEPCYRVVA